MNQSITATAEPAKTVDEADLVRTARVTGLLYLGLAIAGLWGFMVVRGSLFDPDDAAATMTQLVEHELRARLGILLELGIVVTQAFTALWFFRLFRTVDSFAAGMIAVFGLVNAVAILTSAACLATALHVAVEPFGDPGNAQLMYVLSDNLWGVGTVFFGLWLVPMGWCVLRSGWMPRALGWVLVVGGAGYVLSAFARYLVPDAPLVADLMTLPATLGELWIMGYLLIRGVRRGATT